MSLEGALCGSGGGSNKVFRVVLTGGPCSGKTSSLSVIADHFRGLGWHVYTVPEAATTLFHGGVAWDEMSEQQQYVFQKAIVKTMMTFEETFVQIAELNSLSDDKPSLVLCDRGIMDGAAYVSREAFTKMIQEVGIPSLYEAKESRYDLVVHLITAAEGRDEFYGAENNKIRSESSELARHLDKCVLKAWSGHPHIACIDNRTLFKEKIMRAVGAICKRVNVPSPSISTVKRKFLVSSCKDDWTLADGTNITSVDCECEYTYLSDAGDQQQRLRKRSTLDGMFVYTLITRSRGEKGTTHERYTETARTLRKREYELLQKLALPGHLPVTVLKRSFVYKNQYFQLAVVKPPAKPIMLLEIYDDLEQEIDLPVECMVIEKEVTKLSEYSMIRMAQTGSQDSK